MPVDVTGAVEVADAPTSGADRGQAPPASPAFDRVVTVGLLVLAVIGIYAQVAKFQLLSWDRDRIIAAPSLLLEAEAWLSERLYGELKPALFHSVNLLLHLGCVLLVFRLLSRLIENRLAAWAGALWFAVHPLQVESVAWVGEGQALLGALLALAALLFYLPTTSPDGTRNSWLRYFAATICFVAAVFARPAAVALPLVAFLLEWLCCQHSLKRSLLRALPWLAIAAAAMIITVEERTEPPAEAKTTWLQRPIVAGDALAFYLGKLAVPLKLGFDYGQTPQQLLNGDLKLGGGLNRAWLLPIAVLILVSLGRNRRCSWAAVGIFIAVLLPTLDFVPFPGQALSLVADRYAYLAMLGVSLGLAAWLDRHWSRPALVTACLLIGVFARASYVQASYWRDDLSLVSHALEVNPSSYTSAYRLGKLMQDEGRTKDAQAHYRAALELNPNFAPTRNALGIILLEQGRTEQAVDQFRAGIAADPANAEAHINLGDALIGLKKRRQAAAEYEAALAIDPRSADAETHWGDMLLEEGKFYDAILHLRHAVELQPRSAIAHFKYGEALYRSGDLRRAEAEFRLALDCQPIFPEAHMNLGSIHLAHERFDAALAEYEQALALKPRLVEARIMKARALLVQEHKAAALAELRTARSQVADDTPEAQLIDREIKMAEDDD